MLSREPYFRWGRGGAWTPYSHRVIMSKLLFHHFLCQSGDSADIHSRQMLDFLFPLQRSQHGHEWFLRMSNTIKPDAVKNKLKHILLFVLPCFTCVTQPQHMPYYVNACDTQRVRCLQLTCRFLPRPLSSVISIIYPFLAVIGCHGAPGA